MNPGVVSTIAFDHIAIAMEKLADAPAVLVGELGGTSAFGAVSKGFRFGQWRFDGGGRLEILEPRGEDSFLHRFLAQRGPGIHHVTFLVPSLREVCARAEARGYRIVGHDDSFPEWKEAFLHPRQALGIVVQFAETSGGDDGPSPLTLPPGSPNPPKPVRIIGLRMRARGAERAHVQWGEILQGECRENAGGELVFSWAGSPMTLLIDVDPSGEEGPTALEVASERTIAGAGTKDPTLGVVLTVTPPPSARP